jgi:hypothetical protein
MPLKPSINNELRNQNFVWASYLHFRFSLVTGPGYENGVFLLLGNSLPKFFVLVPHNGMTLSVQKVGIK